MNPYGEDPRGGNFRRNVLIIALLHVVILGGLWGFFSWKRQSASGDNIAWLDGGGAPAGGSDSQPTPTPEETPQDDQQDTPTPAPTPEPGRVATPTPAETAQPSQIVLPTPRPVLESITPTPAPEPTAIPTPKPTPKPTPEATPRQTPKPIPHSTPKHHPKPRPKASPHKHPKSKASPHKSPSASPHKTLKPHDQDDTDDGDSSPKAAKTKAAQAAFKHATANGGSNGDEGTAPGTGGGHRGGAGHAGGGDTQGDFGWYHSMLHDRFYNRWNQPTSVAASSASIAAVVKIKIQKDGAISDVSLARSSGNDLVDQSVMEAARQVTQVDPLPEGLGENGVYEVNIEFQLSQSQ